ncbi:MAG: menaquinone biosynthesis protein [Desulfococcaceae bacterium]|jgi:chorismate dehydratase|nr:menaquinone biosynthesis protein [Desulfococcaceae bacterium]
MKQVPDYLFPNQNNVRVGRISYMNVAPVYYGLNNGHKPGWMDMVCAPPATLNAMLAKGELDVSPVSSAAYARHPDQWLLLPDLSISCFGEVMSVILVSRHPFAALSGKTVVLTRESATAAALSRYLFASQGIRPLIRTGKIRCPDDLPEKAGAALLIGDAALRRDWATRFAHVWDLGKMWLDHSGLPFVFALWAVRRSYAEKHPESVSAVIRAFRNSRQQGEQHIHRILPVASQKLGIPADLCRQYYQRLHYDLGPLQIQGLTHFFRGLRRENIIPRPVRLSFFKESGIFCCARAA